MSRLSKGWCEKLTTLVVLMDVKGDNVKKVMEKLFHEKSGAALHYLRFFPLYHVAEGLANFGSFVMSMNFQFERYNAHIKCAHCATS